MRSSWFALSLFILSVGAAPAADQAPRVRSVQLRNGLQVLVLADPQATAADVAVWYRAGVRTESDGRTGLSALLSRLMYEGTKSVSGDDLVRLLKEDGATLNSISNPDYTCFYQTLPCESVELALRLEADRMAALQIAPTRFEAERQRLAEEHRRRVEGNAVATGLERLYAVAYDRHPYARPAGGLEADVERLRLPDAEAYYRERFGPQSAVLTVVGCVDGEATIAAIHRWFDAVPKRPAPPPPAASLPAPGERRSVEVSSPPSPLLLVGWRGPGESDPDAPAVELLSRAISDGTSSRLERLTASRSGMILLVQGDRDAGREASLIYCMAAIRSAADTAAAEAALVSEIEKLASEPLSAEELDRARHHAETALVFGLESVRGRAQALGNAFVLTGDYRAADTRLERLRNITAADVQRVAARILKAENRSVVWVMPKASANPRSRGAGRGQP